MKNYILFLLICGSLTAQNIDELKKKALQNATAVAEASIAKDYDRILKYTHPVILNKYGEASLKKGIEAIYTTMETQNIIIKSSEIEEVTEIKKENNEYRCLVKNHIQMDFAGKLITIKSSLFGFYNKKKEQWYFVESNKLLDDPETIALFKDFKTKIEIPRDRQIPEN